MGREVRRVPADWVHPDREDEPGLQPMYDETFKDAAQKWKSAFLAWEQGINTTMDRPKDSDETDEYWEYDGNPPDPVYYRPDWPEKTRTHYQMYEITSEGTPISPVMETPEKLAQWLVDNNASAFAKDTASYEGWLRVARGGYACSMIIEDGKITSGVEALTKERKEK